MKKFFLLLLLSIGYCHSVLADTHEIYPFKNNEQQTRFSYLTQQLRCLVCQNETLADSDAPLAQDLRNQIASMVQQGISNQKIIHYLVARYGDFVLFNPPFKTSTYLLWSLPFLLLLGSLLMMITRSRNAAKRLPPELSASEQHQLQQLLTSLSCEKKS